MIDYLFICQGNIARSQIAEGFFNHYFKGQLGYSCGIDNVGYKYNYKCYEPATKLMKQRGIDISNQKPKHISGNLIKKSKNIIVFCKESECNNKFPDYLKQHNSIRYIEIVDPNKKGEDFLIDIINKIEKIVKSIDKS